MRLMGSFLRFPVSIGEMKDCQNRMSRQHARTSISHHDPDPLSPRFLVTVDGTLGASWLVVNDRTLVYSLVRITQKFAAIRAETIAMSVMIAAVDCHHCLDSLLLPSDSCSSLHESRHL